MLIQIQLLLPRAKRDIGVLGFIVGKGACFSAMSGLALPNSYETQITAMLIWKSG